MSEKSGLPTGKHTLVEEGTEFKGSLSSKCPIVVMGKVEGDVTGPVIHVTTSGVIAGNVKVKELQSYGEVAGQVEADEVHISGRVRDKTVIRARSLEVSLTAAKGGMEVVFGECELSVGDEPNKEAAISAASAAPAAAAPDPTPAPEPAKAERGQPQGKKKGQADAGWEESAAKGDVEEEGGGGGGGGKRRRATQPPPMS
jgi:cytoskeletal protein CcmA (bactofilin family)